MAIRVAINGFGRIGRLVMRAALEHAGEASSKSSASTISARSRPTRICCATTACMAALPARSRPARTGWMPGSGKIRVTAERDPAKLPWQRARGRCRARMHRHLHQARGGGQAPRSRRQESHHLGPGRRRRSDRRHGRQPRGTEARAPGHLERVVHDQLPGAGRLCAASGDRHRARLHDDDPSYTGDQSLQDTLHSRPAAGAGGGPVDDPDLDRRGAGDRPRACRRSRASSTAPRSACRPPTCR